MPVESEVKNGRFKLNSDSSVNYSPSKAQLALNEFVERVTAFGHPSYYRDYLQPQRGFDTIQYLPATRDSTVSTAKDLLIDFALWVDFSVQANNNLEQYPEAEKMDRFLIEFFDKTFAEMIGDSPREISANLSENGMFYGYGLGERVAEVNEDGWLQLYAVKTFPSYNFDPRQDTYGNLNSVFQYESFEEFSPDMFMFGTWPNRFNGNVLGRSELYTLLPDLDARNRMEDKIFQTIKRNAERPYKHTYAINEQGEPIQSQVISDVQDAISTGAATVHLPGRYDEDKGQLYELSRLEAFEDRTSQATVKTAYDYRNDLNKQITRRWQIPDDYGITNISFGAWKRLVQSSTITSARVWKIQNWIRDLWNEAIRWIIRINGFQKPFPQYRWPTFEWITGEDEWDQTKVEVLKGLKEIGVIDPSEPELNAMIRRMFGIPGRPVEGSQAE